MKKPRGPVGLARFRSTSRPVNLGHKPRLKSGL
jgi:hypothetical protein